MKLPVYLVAMVMALLTANVEGVTKVTVRVDTSKAVHEVGSKFVGVTLDSHQLLNHWGNPRLDDANVRAMAKALAPSYIRVGGTEGDDVTFDTTHQAHGDHVMSGEDWEKLNEFVAAANWSLIFGLNVLKRSGHSWDPANARQLLDFSQRRGYVLAGLELGNEPDIFKGMHNTTVTPEQLARDFKTLVGVKASYSNLKSTLILGPDITRVGPQKRRDYLTTFLKSGGRQAVDAVTLHHYYMNGRTATQAQFMDVKTLDSLRTELHTALSLVSAHAPGKPLWLGETSSAYHGGTSGISDRYVASFMWLDKLGITAQMGLQGVMRQSFYGGHYSLIDSKHQPNPDFWVTLLYKRLVGGRVLSVSTSDSSNHTRVYAHCARGSKGVVLFAMNLNPHDVQLELSPFHNPRLRLYALSPEHGDLLSKNVLLNGHLLAMHGHQVPHLSPSTHHGHVTLPAHQLAFIHLDDVTAPACSGPSNIHPVG